MQTLKEFMKTKLYLGYRVYYNKFFLGFINCNFLPSFTSSLGTKAEAGAEKHK